MKKGPLHINTSLTIILIIYTIFIDKFVYLAPNLSVSISLFLYPLTFLIPILIFNKFKSKEAKKAILSSAIFVASFYIITTLLCNISAHIDTKIIDDALRSIFTPNSISLGNNLFYLPSQFSFTFLIIYLLTHYILIALYDAITTYSNQYLGFGIALFMAFIIDTMFMVPLYHLNAIYTAKVDTIDVIRFLTANFMIVILTGIILSLTYPLIIRKIKEKN